MLRYQQERPREIWIGYHEPEPPFRHSRLLCNVDLHQKLGDGHLRSRTGVFLVHVVKRLLETCQTPYLSSTVVRLSGIFVLEEKETAEARPFEI